MHHPSRLPMLACSLVAVWIIASPELAAQPAAQGTVPPEQIAFFEKNIRPVLVRECYSCHASTAKKIKGKLTLDTREGIRKGGETGPAVVPGDAKKSLLLKAIQQTHDELKMPPTKKLDAAVIAHFEKWIAMGAPDPREKPTTSGKYVIDIEKGRHFWSFVPPKKVPPPTVKATTWPKSDIDRFLLAQMEARDVKPAAD